MAAARPEPVVRKFMPARRLATLSAVLASFALIATLAAPARAQYFGRNKVLYRTFHFDVLHTDHFDIYYYPEEKTAVEQAGRLAERWYARLSDLFAHDLSGRQPM